ncbi:efflux RND transporter permease subunit [Verrucomicrobiaceae bacterium 5K15]|uniref:Efflux RND transporter permease subunit n=1 Tax=Oceaniferula flava TaxID=2800421 RepID=A0AAE2SCI6_9BACT|nr:efflux RND transporter permease subunit [Oceaniferula flavus]MBK1853761.1 efflux RND transporter permease subunit [Oceaniferula flavus]MBM1135068.1 efflux RND transporter permease subunit [Oceaniferula flavus]
MLNKLIRFSLAQRGLILTIALVLLAMGYYRATQLPVEVLPDLTKPTVTILTESPGLAPEEVETLVTVPLENSLMGVTGVTRLRATSDVGLSLIFVEFDWGTDIYQARQFVQERLMGSSETLPKDVVPYMTPVASLMGNIMLLGITDPSGSMEPSELRTMADWTIARRLQGIRGIAEVLSMGGGIKQLQIQPDPEKMLAHDITFDELHKAAQHVVNNTTGGFLTESTQEIMVRNLAMTTDLDALGNTVVKQVNDRSIRIKDVARVEWGIEPMRGDASANGDRGVVVSITKSPGFDTLALTKEVDATLEELRKSLPPGVVLTPIYKQSEFIDLSFHNLIEALWLGGIMVCLILFLFLMNFRVTLITLTSIPLSLGIAILVFDLFDLSVNSMTLGGLAVAIGMVVDDAIVDVENVFRRLKENANHEVPAPKLEVIAAASSEVRSSILYATALIILVFIPLLALSGVEGRLFTPIAIATIVSMAASFVVSLTVIPVLSSLLLNPKQNKKSKESALVRAMKWVLKNTWLKVALAQPFTVIGAASMLLITAALLYPQMGNNFLPSFREPTAVIATTTAPGTSLKQTTELADTASKMLMAIDGVKTVGYRAGRAERGDHVVPVSTVEFEVDFDSESDRSRSDIMEEVRQVMSAKNLPGTFSAMSSPLEDRIGHMLSGVSAQIAIKIKGDDLDELRRIGTEIQTIARAIPGLEEARVEQQAPIPQLRIEVDRERAQAYGITPGELNDRLATLLGGETVSEIYEGQRIFDVVVKLPQEWRESPERLANMYIDTSSGLRIPLKNLADIRQAKGPNTIMRENTQRRFVVSINPTSKDLVSLVEDLQKQVAQKVDLPDGYFISYEGQYVAQQEASKRIALMSVLVLVIIAFLLYSYFGTAVFTLQVLADIPIALIGGIVLTYLTLNNISIATLVGFIAVAGIAARNSIMMISHYLHLMKHEGEGFTREMIERGTLERLVPVLMTALSAGIALLPLVVNMGFLPFLPDSNPTEAPGKEILNPVAIVIVGGLVTSTFLGLGVTPAVFWAFGRKAAQRALENEAPATQ